MHTARILRCYTTLHLTSLGRLFLGSLQFLEHNSRLVMNFHTSSNHFSHTEGKARLGLEYVFKYITSRNFLSSRLISENGNIKINGPVTLFFVLYGYKTWCFTLRKEVNSESPNIG